MNTIATNIKKMRENANLSQQELAERIIVTRQSISNWERGVSSPDIEVLSRIAEALQVDVKELIYEEEAESPVVHMSPARIRQTVVLAGLWLVSLALVIFLLPTLRDYRLIDFQIYPYLIGYCTIYPSVFGIGGALIVSLLSLLGDVYLKNRKLRLTSMCMGFVILFAYPFLLFATSWTDFHAWLWENPYLFVIPGVLLFCGFNRRSDMQNVVSFSSGSFSEKVRF